jgi:5-(carboxyamino)imidazole ribonucleotide mutase
VIGVPGDGGPLQGQDALYSIVQMPPGIPVACVGIGNGANAALLAIQILAAGDASLRARMKEYRQRFGDDPA